MRLVAALVALMLAAPSLAVLPSEQLPDPQMEKRALGITKDLRCVVCQNQSIDDSDAPLAHDLRVIVRERITAGDSDDQARAYVVARYGNFVLLKPPFEANTLALWLGPLLVLLVGGYGVASYLRGRREVPDETLDDSERRRADALLNERP